MKHPLEIIKNGEATVAIILYADFHESGVHFFTPKDFPQQFGFMAHLKGHNVEPHIHNIVKREISLTQEVLFVRKGRLRVDLYDSQKQYLESRELKAGDAILLAGQGHGYEALEDVEVIEVKQGPYLEENDKIRFPRP